MKLKAFVYTGLLVSALFSTGAMAQQASYPTQPIKVVVPYPAGGPSDVLARITADELSRKIGQSVLVENIAGGSGAVGGQTVAQAASDGYTLLLFDITQVLLPNMRENMPYDWQKAFKPVIGVHELPMLLIASTASGAKSVKDLIEASKSDTLSYGSGGIGTLSHILTARLAQLAGVSWTHVPYRGLAPAVAAVRGGNEVAFAFVSPPEALAFIQSGDIVALATTGGERSPLLPNVPTLEEEGIDIKATLWTNGYVVPTGTSDDIVDKLRTAISATVNEPQVREKIAALGMSHTEMQGEAFEAFLQSEMSVWGDVVKSNNIRLGE